MWSRFSEIWVEFHIVIKKWAKKWKSKSEPDRSFFFQSQPHLVWSSQVCIQTTWSNIITYPLLYLQILPFCKKKYTVFQNYFKVSSYCLSYKNFLSLKSITSHVSCVSTWFPLYLVPKLILLLDWSQSSKTLSTPTPIIEILPKILKMPKIFCYKLKKKHIEDPPVTTLAARFTFKH